MEQGYKQLKHELGWADFQVRADRAIRAPLGPGLLRLLLLLAGLVQRVAATPTARPGRAPARGAAGPTPAPARRPGGGKGVVAAGRRRAPLLAGGAPARAGLARPLDLPLALLARLVDRAPAAGAPRPPRRRRAGHPLDLYVPT